VSLLIDINGGIARFTLNRPDVHNAFDEVVIAELRDAYDRAAADTAVRAIVLHAAGKSFSSGGDLNWMKRMAGFSHEENLADARSLAGLMRAIDCSPKPTLARVQGSVFAGALGMIACSDIAIAVPEAEFAVTEVRVGLIPAVISPYLVRAIGVRQVRRWFLTAERFSAVQAQSMGLIHEVVSADQLDAAITRTLDALLKAGPASLAATKALVAAVDRPLDEGVIDETAARIAAIRASDEGREGVTAFLEKRKPSWLAAKP
jgi:methylglutaconyl-CoA hydratase